MPWCPKCKSEYREGFTICTDCGSELVSEEAYAKLETERKTSELEQYKLRIQEMISESDETDGQEYAEQGDECADSEETGELEQKDEGTGSEAFGKLEKPVQKSAGNSGRERAAYSVYEDSTERASENRSSAWVLMAVGGGGIVFITLGIAGVLPLKLGNPYLFYGVMAAVFILFLVAGIVSMKNARIFEKKAESENSLRDTMLAWCRENLHAEELDRQIGADGSEAEEILYFKRFECIKAKLNYQFVNLDQGFLDKFIDDSVYDMVYEEREGSA